MEPFLLLRMEPLGLQGLLIHHQISMESSTANSTFVTMGGSGIILTSLDGTSWTSRTSGASDTLWGVIYGKSAYVVVVGTLGTVLTSSDLTTWTSRTSNTANNLLEVTYRE